MERHNFIFHINFFAQTNKEIKSCYLTVLSLYFFMTFSLALENRSPACSPDIVQGYLWTACNPDSDDTSQPLQDRMSDRVHQHVKIH